VFLQDRDLNRSRHMATTDMEGTTPKKDTQNQNQSDVDPTLESLQLLHTDTRR
jgi:hypothetical protein